MTYDADLNLLVCEHATSSLVRFRPDGTREVLASAFRGARAEQPQRCLRALRRLDLLHRSVVRPHAALRRGAAARARLAGRVPPPPGHRPGERAAAGRRPLHLQPAERPVLLARRALLYVNDTEQANIRVFEVRATARCERPHLRLGIRDSLKPGVPDGMKCDAEGNVWVTAPGGVWVYRARRAADRQGRRSRSCRPTCIGAGRTGARCSSAPPPRSMPSTSRSGRATSPSCARAPPPGATPPHAARGDLRLDAARCALIIQDMQNDVVMEGGAFADLRQPRSIAASRTRSPTSRGSPSAAARSACR
jgi:gluconolactonase